MESTLETGTDENPVLSISTETCFLTELVLPPFLPPSLPPVYHASC
jgi:hypothetical protein